MQTCSTMQVIFHDDDTVRPLCGGKPMSKEMVVRWSAMRSSACPPVARSRVERESRRSRRARNSEALALTD